MSGATYRISTSGAGSSFEAWIKSIPPGGNRYSAQMVERATGFRSRSEALAWGRRRIKEIAASEH